MRLSKPTVVGSSRVKPRIATINSRCKQQLPCFPNQTCAVFFPASQLAFFMCRYSSPCFRPNHGRHPFCATNRRRRRSSHLVRGQAFKRKSCEIVEPCPRMSCLLGPKKLSTEHLRALAASSLPPISHRSPPRPRSPDSGPPSLYPPRPSNPYSIYALFKPSIIDSNTVTSLDAEFLGSTLAPASNHP